VIGRALEKEPARRWATANEMADVLDAAAAGAPPNTTIAGLGAGRVIRRAPGGANPRPAASGRGRRFAAAGAVALLAVGGAGAWYAARGEGGVPRGVDPRRSYLVAPFEVLTGDPQLGWLREASVSMLSTNLAQWNDVAVVDYERSLDLLRDANLDGAARIGLEDAQRMARRAGAWTVVMGQVTNTPDSLIVVARVYDVASGRRVDEAQRSAARAADPRPLYDALARDLLDLAGAPANIALGTLAETTTPSVEAYRAYLDGLRALNGWQLARADSLFRRATQADTAFALAYYKRALTMGWQSAGDTAQRTLVALALRHSARLLPRDRDLVSAYADLTGALTHADSAESNAAFLSAQRKYAAIIARDSSAAEAWYGLGDAYFHHQPNPSAQVANWSRALRAFNRTLALDSTFHLAFSHKVQIYQNAASPAVPVLLDGDSLRPLFTDADRRALGPARIQQARDSARQLATRDARAWVAVDPAPQAYQALADLYMSIGQYDSAAAVVREAMATPSARSPILPFYEVALLMRTDPAAAPASLRAVLRTTSAAELAAGGGSDRFFAILNAAGAAMLGGRASDVRAAMSLAAAVQPMLPGLGYSTPAMTRWFAVGAELALGMPPAPLRVALDSGARFIDRLPGAPRGSIQTQSMSVPYVAYLVTRDPRFLAVVRRWQRPDAAPLTELDALEALTAGDTARALQAARAFPSPDSVRAATGARVGAMRWVARAEVLAGLGDARRALGMYDVLDPTRFAAAGPLDLSWALYPRSFLARGRLYEQLGERESAAAAYTRFVELWKDADPALQPQLREAREGLGRVRDLPSTISAR
jgi:tetratricopeptide (TPR) repeat protein